MNAAHGRRLGRDALLGGLLGGLGLVGFGGCSGPSIEQSRLQPRYGLKLPPGRTTQPATAPAFLQTARVTTDAGWDQLRRGRLDPAMQDFNAAWRIDPSDGRTLWGMAAVEVRRAERLGSMPSGDKLDLLDQACQLYDDAVRQGVSPTALLLEAAGTRTLRGQDRRTLREDGAGDDFAAAERYLRAADRGGPSAAVLQAWATLERARGNAAAAQAYDRRAATTPAAAPAIRPATRRAGEGITP